MISGDQDYYLARAEQELERARSADHPEAARAHSLLAGFYFDRAHRTRQGGATMLAGA